MLATARRDALLPHHRWLPSPRRQMPHAMTRKAVNLSVVAPPDCAAPNFCQAVPLIPTSST